MDLEEEVRRRVREFLYRQRGDIGLVLRGARVLMGPGNRVDVEEMRRNVERVFEGLGETLLGGR